MRTFSHVVLQAASPKGPCGTSTHNPPRQSNLVAGLGVGGTTRIGGGHSIWAAPSHCSHVRADPAGCKIHNPSADALALTGKTRGALAALKSKLQDAIVPLGSLADTDEMLRVLAP
eukprot:COSAG05_NODE_9623_length_611_cov_0.892578_1_plen_115_part_10